MMCLPFDRCDESVGMDLGQRRTAWWRGCLVLREWWWLKSLNAGGEAFGTRGYWYCHIVVVGCVDWMMWMIGVVVGRCRCYVVAEGLHLWWSVSCLRVGCQNMLLNVGGRARIQKNYVEFEFVLQLVVVGAVHRGDSRYGELQKQ